MARCEVPTTMKGCTQVNYSKSNLSFRVGISLPLDLRPAAVTLSCPLLAAQLLRETGVVAVYACSAC